MLTVETYRRNGRMAVLGDLFGCLVSDLVPKSTEVSSLQLVTQFRVDFQQQLASLVCTETTLLYTVSNNFYFYDKNNGT